MNDNLYIDKLPKLCPNLQLVSIYNMDGCSGVENIYKISNKVNEVIRTLNAINSLTISEIENLTNRVNELLDKGLKEDVQEVINTLVANGQLGAMVKNSIEELRTEVTELREEVANLNMDVAKITNSQTVDIPTYTQDQLVDIVNPVTGSMVVNSTSGKVIIYLNGRWVNLDGTEI